MPEENTTAIVQRYLGELTGEAPAEPVVRVLLGRAVPRLQRFCATLLHHDYAPGGRGSDLGFRLARVPVR